MAVMDAGRVRQLDRPDRVLAQPADDFVARFLGKHRFQLQMSTVLVRDVMNEEPVTVRLSERKQPVVRAVEMMRKHRVTSLIAVDEGRRLLGVVTAEAVRGAGDAAAVDDIVARDTEPVAPDTDLLSATHAMANSHHTALPVVDAARRVIGILTVSSLVGVFAEGLRAGPSADEGAEVAVSSPRVGSGREAQPDD